jgi:hypothetical protein
VRQHFWSIAATAVLITPKTINSYVAAMPPGQHQGHIDVDHLRENQHRCDLGAASAGRHGGQQRVVAGSSLPWAAEG